MKPEYTQDMQVKASCPDCGGALATFERNYSGRDLGYILIDQRHTFNGREFPRVVYRLFRCAGCGRGGIAKLHDNGNEKEAVLESFFPTSIERAKIPAGVPPGIEAELREAELCASVEAWRAASALLRSTLEKTLKVNGYAKGDLEKANLKQRIDAAAVDGVVTAARKEKAHTDIRVLGNDVLHDEWRQVTREEVEAAHHYTQRILEDFYDDRATVEAILKAKGRLP